jgi:D-alanine-D-alanine ligase
MPSARDLVDARLAVAGGVWSELRCVVLGGGSSSERDVSLVSARGIAAALRTTDAESPWPLASVREIEIDAAARWIVDGSALSPERALEQLASVDVFFLGLHGGSGEDGTLQGLLESAGRSYTGSGVGASAACMDKWLARAAAQSIGVHVAAGLLIDADAWQHGPAGERRERLDQALALARPNGCVVKPRHGGSSVATRVLRPRPGSTELDSRELESAIGDALRTRDDALVEALVPGIEITAPVLRSGRTVEGLMPVEIQPRDGAFFDYQQKYSPDGAREYCPPRNVDGRAWTAAAQDAMALHRLFRCGSYSRTDFIVARGGPHDGKPVFLEVNTLPGMTPRSLLPQSALVHGIGYRKLCLFLLLGALERSTDSAQPV